MRNSFITEAAYKPAEKLAFDYFMIRSLFSKLLKEQKFPLKIENMMLKIYKLFQTNADTLVKLYEKVKGLLPLNDLLNYVDDEIDAVFADSELMEPLMDSDRATRALTKFLIDIEASFLNDAEQYVDSIPGFKWNIESFKKAFDAIIKKGEQYDSYEQIRSAEAGI